MTARRTPSNDSRFGTSHVRETLPVAMLMVAFSSLAAYTIDTSGWQETSTHLWFLAALASMLGIGLAASRFSETWTQSIGVLAGVVMVTARVLSSADQFGGNLVSRVGPFFRYVFRWYTGREPEADGRDLLVAFLMGLIVWLTSFFAGWILIRRGWLALALLMPAVMAIANQVIGDEVPAWVMIAMTLIGVLISVIHNGHVQQQRWARRRLASPGHILQRFAVVGVVLAVIVGGAGSATSGAVGNYVLMPAVERAASAWESFAQFTNDALGISPTSESSTLSGYQQFGDGFSMTGPVKLGDTPMVQVVADGKTAPYLTAHTYDRYTGRGWESSTEADARDRGSDGERVSPELLFAPQQELVLSPGVTEARMQRSTRITPLTDDGGVMLSVDTYLTADQQAVVRMSWQDLDDVGYPVTPESLRQLPPTIQHLANLLIQADLSGDQSDAGPLANSTRMQEAINTERTNLAHQGVTVRWDANGNGLIQTLYVSGRLPVYDDVESIYRRNTTSDRTGTYRVTSLSSTASPTELADAGMDYPGWVTARYLAPGDSLTQRTTDLTSDITAGAADPYGKAKAVEAYLRSNIAYDTNVDAPPDGHDLVDWVLFEDPTGYCEHYASAMTVMMRSQGIPARTVVGYHPGDPDPAAARTFVYRQFHAHAWTEVFFPGYGWIPFEPTANRPLDQFAAPSPTAAAEPTEAIPTEAIPTPDVSQDNTQSTPITQSTPKATPNPAAAIDMPTTGVDRSMPSWVAPAAVAAVVLAGLAGLLWYGWNRHLRDLAPSDAMFRRLERAGSFAGVTRAATATPREFGERFVDQAPSIGEPIRDIVRVYEADHYGPRPVGRRGLDVANRAWRLVRSRIPGIVMRGRASSIWSQGGRRRGKPHSRLRGD